jgi:hypothetical protein
MDVRFALTQQALAAAAQHGDAVSLFLDGMLVWEKSFNALGPYLGGEESTSEAADGNGVAGVITLALPLSGGGMDLAAPYHEVEVAVGGGFSSRAEFRLEVSSVEPQGCSRSAVVPALARGGAVAERVAAGREGESEWHLPRDEAAYGQEEMRVFSQNGEDGVLSAILEEVCLLGRV